MADVTEDYQACMDALKKEIEAVMDEADPTHREFSRLLVDDNGTDFHVVPLNEDNHRMAGDEKCWCGAAGLEKIGSDGKMHSVYLHYEGADPPN